MVKVKGYNNNKKERKRHSCVHKKTTNYLCKQSKSLLKRNSKQTGLYMTSHIKHNFVNLLGHLQTVQMYTDTENV